jgi:hypothetical protein
MHLVLGLARLWLMALFGYLCSCEVNLVPSFTSIQLVLVISRAHSLLFFQLAFSASSLPFIELFEFSQVARSLLGQKELWSLKNKIADPVNKAIEARHVSYTD